MTDSQNPLQGVQEYFTQTFEAHGATYKGVDYGNDQRQLICFEQLLKIVSDKSIPFSLNDYGCGYGALIPYLLDQKYAFQYIGMDITVPLVEKSRELYSHLEHCRFVTSDAELQPADYTIASGVFNIKLERSYDDWTNYLLQELHKLWSLSTKGMSFNILTKYSDPDKMRDYLYYADPLFLFDYCKRNFSKEVALLHDYGVYEFTILVRR